LLSREYLFAKAIALATAVGALYFLFFRKKQYQRIVKKFEKDKVYLFVFPGHPLTGMNPSPPCLKLETYLRLSGINYEIVKGVHLNNAPKQKLPFIELNGEATADSELIIQRLQDQFGSLDTHLDGAQRAAGVAFTRLVDEHLYWCLVHFRWLFPAGYKTMMSTALGTVPIPIRWFVAYIVVRNIKSQIWGHGLGRHTPQEILCFAEKDLEAMADTLGDKRFFFGDKPSTADACLFSIIYNILRPKYDYPLKDSVLKHKNLVDYCEFMTEKYFGDKKLK